MENKIILSEQEKEVITRLSDNIYDVEFIEEWINRNDNVEANALSALQAMGAKGYYKAIQNMTQYENKTNIQNDEQTSENALMENNTTNENTTETDQKKKPKKYFNGTPLEKKIKAQNAAYYMIPIIILCIISGQFPMLIIPFGLLWICRVCYLEGDRELREYRREEHRKMLIRIGEDPDKADN